MRHIHTIDDATKQNWCTGTTFDIFKFNPWRAPGKAPVFDSCGMAGGRWTEAFNAAAFNTTRFAKMGDLGTKVLPPRPTGTVWKRGGHRQDAVADDGRPRRWLHLPPLSSGGDPGRGVFPEDGVEVGHVNTCPPVCRPFEGHDDQRHRRHQRWWGGVAGQPLSERPHRPVRLQRDAA